MHSAKFAKIRVHLFFISFIFYRSITFLFILHWNRNAQAWQVIKHGPKYQRHMCLFVFVPTHIHALAQPLMLAAVPREPGLEQTSTCERNVSRVFYPLSLSCSLSLSFGLSFGWRFSCDESLTQTSTLMLKPGNQHSARDSGNWGVKKIHRYIPGALFCRGERF